MSVREFASQLSIIEGDLNDLIHDLHDTFVEREYRIMHEMLVSLGVTNPDDLEQIAISELGHVTDEITVEHAERFLAALEYVSSHRAIAAANSAGAILHPLDRLLRAIQIWSGLRDCCSCLSQLRERSDQQSLRQVLIHYHLNKQRNQS